MFSLQQITITFDTSFPMLWYKVGLALFIGLLIGVERERHRKKGERIFAGIRTFPMISLLGFLSAFVSYFTSFAFYIVFIVVLGILLSISYYLSAKEGGLGGTSEIATMLVFVLGSLVFWDHLLLSVALAVVLVTLLSMKPYLRSFTEHISEEDIIATIKFAIITIIVLPLLPNKFYGPFNTFNPQKIWLLVVLIAGMSFVGYILFKIVGTKKGILLLAFLGGLVSSTAVTLSYTQRSKEMNELSKDFASGIILASTIMFPRVLIVIYILNVYLGNILIIPFGVFILAGLLFSFFISKKRKSTEVKDIKLSNPFKIISAIKFGLLFTAILFVTNLARHYLGEQGIYLTSLLGGVADVDAIVLTIADLSIKSLPITIAASAVVIACVTNSIIKLSIVLFGGSTEIKKYSLYGFGIIIFLQVVFLVYMLF